MIDNFSECSLSVIVENKPTLCSPLTLTQRLFGRKSSTSLHLWTSKLQYITSSMDKDQVLRETFDKVQTLQQKNVFLFVDEVQIRPTVSISGRLLSGMAESNRDCKATSIVITRHQGTVRVKERQYSDDYYTHSICCQPFKFAVTPSNLLSTPQRKTSRRMQTSVKKAWLPD
ncbi:hypothetical protein FHG87_001981 [Trinorchestia longiramus]|nr:hypothetical protein FHG87_001981 [Trinorchestia longiramus]